MAKKDFLPLEGLSKTYDDARKQLQEAEALERLTNIRKSQERAAKQAQKPAPSADPRQTLMSYLTSGNAPAGMKVSDYLDSLYATGQMDDATAAYYASKRQAAGQDPVLNYTEKEAASISAQKGQELADYKDSKAYKNRGPDVSVPTGADSPAAFVGNIAGQYLGNLFSTGAWSGDTKEAELKSQRDYYKNLSESAADQKVMRTDLAAVANWPEEDRQELKRAYKAISARGWTYGIATAGLAKKYGKETVDAIMESYSRYRNQQEAQAITESAQKFAGRDAAIANPLAFPASVGANLVGGVSGAVSQAGSYLEDKLGISTGRYKTLDPYVSGNRAGIWGQAAGQAYWDKSAKSVGDVAQTVTGSEKAEDLAEKYVKTVGGAAQSAAENLILVYATGGTGSLALMSARGFSDAMREATERGASPDQALLFGVASAGLEAATEKLSLDELLDAAKAGKSGFVQALKQGGIEATEEELSFLGGLVADAVIMQDKSQYRQTVADLVAGGMSYEDAVQQANAQVWQEAKQTALQSLISGGMMSGAQSVASGISEKAGLAQQAQQYEADKNDGYQFVQNILAKAKEKPAQQATSAAQSGETSEDVKAPTQMETGAEGQQTAQAVQQTATGNQQTVSESASDISSVRTQLRASQNELNAMRPVAEVQVSQEFTQLDKAGKQNWVIEKLRSTGYKVERKGFGVINFAKKYLKSAFNYFKSGSAEEVAFEALPYVLENGVEISSHDDHKGRNYKTVTIAAPVTINGKRGNMAVVVKQTTDNYYKVHRILTPDGSVFNLSEGTSEAEPTPAGESPETGSLATPIGSASGNSIHQTSQNVNPSNTPSPDESVGAAPAGFSGTDIEEAQSKVIENTYRNATDEEMRRSGEAALKEDPDIGTYYVSKEKDSVRFAKARTETPEQIEYEYNYLMENGINSAEDNDTAMIVRKALFAKNDPRYRDIVRLQKLKGTQSGQIIQSFAKYTRMTGEDVAAEAVTKVDALKEGDVPSRFWKKDGFAPWQEKVTKSVMDVANQIDAVEDGDVDSMKDIIRSLGKWRNTTAWFGLSSDLTKAAEAAMKTIDFDTAKAIANAQLSTLPNDFKKRPVGQVVKTIRIHNMLSALTTVNRNLGGNTAVGFIDATSDSTTGRFFDNLVSKVTGKRTVGNDITYGKEYFAAAWNATKMASLCAELDIPMDSESRFTTGTTRTYSPQGNPVMRFMSAYEKYMKYALEVTDQFYDGGANAAVEQSLRDLGGANLTDEEIKNIADLAGQRRTLKDERTATRLAKTIRKGLNWVGTENIGLGDLTMPFASIGSTSAHVAIDYTAGAVTGTAQVLKLMSDVKKGRYVNGVKTIYKNGKPVQTVTLAEAQRAAVTNLGRGITGLGVVSVFAGLAAAGLLKVHNDEDKDKRGLEQAQNLSGAQLNVDAALRALQGKGTDWQDDDLVVSVDFLEPFNAQMYLGYLLSQEESVLDAVKAAPEHAVKSVVSSVADMPAMQGMQEALDILSGLQDVGEDVTFGQWVGDAVGQVAGSLATGFIPGWLRQTAQVIDPYYRDTSGDTTINQVKAAIPGLSQTLPKKYSGLGQEQLRNDDWIAGVLNTMVNPGDADRIKTTEVSAFIDELYDLTGDLGIYPDAAAPKSFDQDKVTYTISTKEQTEIYQRTYGSEVNNLYGELMKLGDFQNLSDAEQVEVFKKAKDAARALAKSKISGKYDPPSAIKDKPIYMSDAQAILDAYIEAKKKAERKARKEAYRDS